MNTIVEIKGLSKSYKRLRALNNIELNIEKGTVLGILGPNGSGKTTLIKIIVGILNGDSGRVIIDGNEPGIASKKVVSYLSDRNTLYSWMKIEDALKLYKDFYDDFDEDKAIKMLEFMKLEKNMKVSQLSKGMKEKLNLTLVLSRKAKLYVLDEPIAGVDPVARDQILNAIIDNLDEDSTMLITTHLVRDMENIFDKVAFLKDGEITLFADAEGLREEKGMQIDDIYKEIFA